MTAILGSIIELSQCNLEKELSMLRLMAYGERLILCKVNKVHITANFTFI